MEKSWFRRLRRMIFLPIFNLMLSKVTRFWTIKRLLLKIACVNVGSTTRVVGPLVLGNAVRLSVGNGTWLGQDFCVYGSGECIIGNNCDIGPNVVVLSGSHKIGNADRRAGKGLHFRTEIGNGVWIGGRSTIYGNIKIDDSSVVAAGAVVRKNVDRNTIVGGVPAKLIRKL